MTALCPFEALLNQAHRDAGYVPELTACPARSKSEPGFHATS
jgi:hypothetical protein